MRLNAAWACFILPFHRTLRRSLFGHFFIVRLACLDVIARESYPMSDKQLAVRQSLSVSTGGRSIAPHEDLDVIVDQLLRRNGHEGTGTVDEILGHPQVKKHGMLGRLSSGQQSLVTSVVSLMQDRVATDARKNADALKQIIIHEREALSHMSRSFAETAKHLYQLPLITRAQRDYEHGMHDAPPAHTHGGGVTQPPPPRAPVWERFLTWGNLLAGTAVVLAVLVVKTSVETASYETQYRLTQENLEQTRIELEKTRLSNEQLVAQNHSLGEQNASLTAKLDALEKQSVADRQRLGADIKTQASQLVEARQTIARQQAQLSQSESSKTVGQSRLGQQIGSLQQQLAVLSTKEAQQAEQIQTYKQIAKDRENEIRKLQMELQARQAVTEESSEKQAKFLGLF